jgi:general secretion pathway protein G
VPIAFLGGLHLSVTVALATIAAVGYLSSLARHQRRNFCLLDSLTIVLLMTVVTAAGAPMLEAAVQDRNQSVLAENWSDLQSQIDVYKAEHGGRSPVLYRGTLPQLTAATDATGMPGPRDRQHPYGPYFLNGITANPVNGCASVTATDTFPPEQPTGKGGWIYHEPTGQIAPDVAR